MMCRRYKQQQQGKSKVRQCFLRKKKKKKVRYKVEEVKEKGRFVENNLVLNSKKDLLFS